MYKLIATVISILMLVAPSVLALDCSTTQIISSSQTLADNYTSTSANNCFIINGANTVLNMGGHTVTCNNSSGCGAAFDISSTGKVRNGQVLNGTGRWSEGVQCYNYLTSSYTDCNVENMLIRGASLRAIRGAKTVETTVMVDTPECIDTAHTIGSGGQYQQNYCHATDRGFAIDAPTSGSHTVQRNFIRVDDVSGTGVLIRDGNVTMTHNIVEASTPFDDAAADSSTLSENICPDAGDCPDPVEEGFSLTVDFN